MSSQNLTIYSDAAIIWLKIKHPLLQYNTQKRETQLKKKEVQQKIRMWANPGLPWIHASSAAHP